MFPDCLIVTGTTKRSKHIYKGRQTIEVLAGVTYIKLEKITCCLKPFHDLED
jgi:hypothetical protein